MRFYKYGTELTEDMTPMLVKEQCYTMPELNRCDTAEKVVKVMREAFTLHKKTEEHVYAVCMNAKCHIVGIFEVSHGTVNSSCASPREVFMKALLLGAVSIILVHNHRKTQTQAIRTWK